METGVSVYSTATTDGTGKAADSFQPAVLGTKARIDERQECDGHGAAGAPAPEPHF